jgi:hypothetical protein
MRLSSAIELIELRCARIGDESLRDADLGNSTDTYFELAEPSLTIETGDNAVAGDWQGAFAASERGHKRSPTLRRRTRSRLTPSRRCRRGPAAAAYVTLLVAIEHAIRRRSRTREHCGVSTSC